MEDILAHLPERSMWEKELYQFADDPSVNEDLGHLMVYSCELYDGIDPEDSWIMESKQKKRWMARCCCTNCQEEFVTAKMVGQDEILLYEGEDGQLYEVVGDVAGYGEGGQVIAVESGDHINCPYCGIDTRLIHSSKIRDGRTKRIMVETLETVKGHTAIMYWMISRKFDEFGMESDSVYPFMAEVITENGKLKAYTHGKCGMYGVIRRIDQWQPYSGKKWPEDFLYTDWGSIQNKKMGAASFRKKLPDMKGTTGEKTGIYQYIKNGGNHPYQYMTLWQKCRGVENLLNCGLFKVVEDIATEAYKYSSDVLTEAKKYINVNCSKPHEILGLTKVELREWLQQGVAPTLADLKNVRWYKNLGGQLPAHKASALMKSFGDGFSAVKELVNADPSIDLTKIEAYLNKQGLRKTDVRFLTDVRRFAQQLNPGAALTYEQLWPRRLMETHDRLSQAVALITDDSNEKNFLLKAKQLQSLEWTDGELCIVIPKSNSDLVREGEILQHCVGTYGKSHLAGKDTIFFVRRYRKKNTPYYTLDINLTGRPRRVQLHGYGNERHGKNKSKTHTIPKEVLAFCERWENEVLMPWYLTKQKKERKTA